MAGGRYARLLAALIALFALGLAASSGTSATITTEAVNRARKDGRRGERHAGHPIGFRIDLTNRGADPATGRIVIEKRVEPNWAFGSFNFTGDLGSSHSAAGGTGRIVSAPSPGALPGTRAVTGPPRPPAPDYGFAARTPTRRSICRRAPRPSGSRPARPSAAASPTHEAPGQDHHREAGRSRTWARRHLRVHRRAGHLAPAASAARWYGACRAPSQRAPGTYEVTEAPATGARVDVGLDCDDANSTVDPAPAPRPSGSRPTRPSAASSPTTKRSGPDHHREAGRANGRPGQFEFTGDLGIFEGIGSSAHRRLRAARCCRSAVHPRRRVRYRGHRGLDRWRA